MTAREELAAVLVMQSVRVQVPNVGVTAGFLRIESAQHLADTLLAPPALARVVREAKAEAWDEGRRSAGICLPTNPPKSPTNPYRDQTEEPT